MDLRETDRFKWNSKVACRTLEGTSFILFNSRMIRLNEVGSRIWDRCQDGATIADIVADIVAAFDATEAQVKADTLAFVGGLVEREMLVLVVDAAESGRSP